MLNKKKGFTLIELLISLFIGSILLLSLTATNKHIKNSTSLKEEKKIIYENSLQFLTFFKKDMNSAGYEEYDSDNGEIEDGFVYDDNDTTDTSDDSITITYDKSKSERIEHKYTFDKTNKKVLVNDIPLVSKVKDINWSIDSNNNERIITHITFEGYQKDIQGNNIEKHFKSINYVENDD
jgi:prepilin-type N-terminal cleavage/methylation domain-containing protein